MARKQEKYTVKKFNKTSVGLSSPKAILEVSKGKVLKSETIKQFLNGYADTDSIYDSY